MIDAVLSYHTNPATCGVAKFNMLLARRLGVPFESLDRHPFACPLISVKTAEALDWWDVTNWYRRCSLFLHDAPRRSHQFDYFPKSVEAIYTGNAAITEAVRALHDNVTTLWCPPTLEGCPDRGGYRVLTFGMIHKIAAQQFTQLKARLDVEQPEYTVAVSAAIHEGTDHIAEYDRTVRVLRSIFGARLRVLGFLADDALAREIAECDAVAVFFDPALRANNTSAWAVLEAGKPLITNTDEASPVLDVQAHSWDALLQKMGVHVAV